MITAPSAIILAFDGIPYFDTYRLFFGCRYSVFFCHSLNIGMCSDALCISLLLFSSSFCCNICGFNIHIFTFAVLSRIDGRWYFLAGACIVICISNIISTVRKRNENLSIVHITNEEHSTFNIYPGHLFFVCCAIVVSFTLGTCSS